METSLTQTSTAQRDELKASKTRLLGKQGNRISSLKLEEIVLLISIKKSVFAINTNNEKYLCNENLGELALVLGNRFFRANRQYIINIDHLQAFETFKKVKLKVEMRLPAEDRFIVVSQENSKVFKKWIAEQ